MSIPDYPPAGGTMTEPREDRFGFFPIKKIKKPSILFLAICLVIISGITLYTLDPGRLVPSPLNPSDSRSGFESQVVKFGSDQEFREYFAKAQDFYSAGSMNFRMSSEGIFETDLMAPNIGVSLEALEDTGAGRVSTTNVQVLGVDEPDIVKTDGREIYFSGQWSAYPGPIILEDTFGLTDRRVPPRSLETVKAIQAFPPANLAQLSLIDESGELLLVGDRLIVFANDGIVGFDIRNPAQPVQAWEQKYESGQSLVSARLYKEEVYLILSRSVGGTRTCPQPVFEGFSVNCIDIYHPVGPVAADAIYTILKVEPADGEITKTVSFAGQRSATVTYVSLDNIYLVNRFAPQRGKFYLDFLLSVGDDFIPPSVRQRVNELASYEISDNSLMTEVQLVLEEYMLGLGDDELLKWENEMENKLGDYFEAHKREYEVSGVAKVDLESFKIAATGTFPGWVLNQFSLDEYQGNLRVATTIGGRWGIGDKQANDVHVLNEKLNLIGSATEMGLNERIYSARFVKDRGYLVTFRQIDPFYVLDLTNPRQPEVKGELKIPGYSSYLHPIRENLVLGVGEEGNKVKLSLFDVTDPANPLEVDKYLLDEYWSEVNSNHRAFLQDADHEVFFLPGGRGGYVFSYQNDQLGLARAVAETSVRRAVYLNDYLYLIGNEELVVLNESDWVEVNRLDLTNANFNSEN